MLFPAEAPSCGSEFWRWQESAAGGGQPASWPAGVSAELCGRFYNRCLPNSAVSLRNRVGKLCEEHRWKVHTPFVLQGVDHLFVLTELFLNLSPFNTGTEKAFESSQSLKSVWLPSMLPVKNTAIPQAQTQVADQTKKNTQEFLYLFVFLYVSLDCFVSFLCLRLCTKSDTQNPKRLAVTERSCGWDRVTCSIAGHHGVCSEHRDITEVQTSTYRHHDVPVKNVALVVFFIWGVSVHFFAFSGCGFLRSPGWRR